jgi:hypothetical protein
MIKFSINKVYTYIGGFGNSQEFTLINRTKKTVTFSAKGMVTTHHTFEGETIVKKRIKVGFCESLDANVEYVTPYPNKNCLLTALDNDELVVL